MKTYYYEDVITADPSFGEIPFEFKSEQITEVHGPLLTVVEIIIILVAVICIILLISGIFICYIVTHRKKGKNHSKIEKHDVVVKSATEETEKTVKI